MLFDFESAGARPSPVSKPVTSKVLTKACFDANLAILVGIPGALICKYLECSIRSRAAKSPGKTIWVWKTAEQFAGELGMTVKAFRLVVQKLKRRKVIKTEKRASKPTNHTLSYAFRKQEEFLDASESGRNIYFNPGDADKWGYCSAVLLNSFRYWTRENQPDESHQFDGRTWHYDSLARLTKVYAGQFTKRQIKASLLKLVKEGVLLRRPYKENDRRDPRRWYAFADQSLVIPTGPLLLETPISEPKPSVFQPSSKDEVQKGQITGPKRANQRSPKDKSIGVLYTPSYSSSVHSRSPQKRAQETYETRRKPASLACETFSFAPGVPETSRCQPSDLKSPVNGSSISDRPKVCQTKARQLYRETYQKVFNRPPTDSLGKVKAVQEHADEINVTVPVYLLTAMLAWTRTHPDQPFFNRYLATNRCARGVQGFVQATRNFYACADPVSIQMFLNQGEAQNR